MITVQKFDVISRKFNIVEIMYANGSLNHIIINLSPPTIWKEGVVSSIQNFLCMFLYNQVGFCYLQDSKYINWSTEVFHIMYVLEVWWSGTGLSCQRSLGREWWIFLHDSPVFHLLTVKSLWIWGILNSFVMIQGSC